MREGTVSGKYSTCSLHLRILYHIAAVLMVAYQSGIRKSNSEILLLMYNLLEFNVNHCHRCQPSWRFYCTVPFITCMVYFLNRLALAMMSMMLVFQSEICLNLGAKIHILQNSHQNIEFLTNIYCNNKTPDSRVAYNSLTKYYDCHLNFLILHNY